MSYLSFSTILAVIGAYLIGSISSAIVTCKIMKLPDPRTQGSGNPGATNVLRASGKKAGIITLLGDTLKGVIVVCAAKFFHFDSIAISAVTIAVFLGHLYPIFFHFKGGKGVATAFGCLFALAWPIGVALLITWLAMAIVFRYSSLAALTAALLAPVYTWYFTNLTFTLMACVMSLLLIYRHYSNICNLMAGKERKIGKPQTNSK
jgi:glycerol-3-phosphate acyltransferase PlsY